MAVLGGGVGSDTLSITCEIPSSLPRPARRKATLGSSCCLLLAILRYKLSRATAAWPVSVVQRSGATHSPPLQCSLHLSLSSVYSGPVFTNHPSVILLEGSLSLRSSFDNPLLSLGTLCCLSSCSLLVLITSDEPLGLSLLICVMGKAILHITGLTLTKWNKCVSMTDTQGSLFSSVLYPTPQSSALYSLCCHR